MTASAKANPNQNLSRREALNYAFGASIALALIGCCIGLIWFLGKSASDVIHDEAHGYFQLDLSNLPEAEKDSDLFKRTAKLVGQYE